MYTIRFSLTPLSSEHAHKVESQDLELVFGGLPPGVAPYRGLRGSGGFPRIPSACAGEPGLVSVMAPSGALPRPLLGNHTGEVG